MISMTVEDVYTRASTIMTLVVYYEKLPKDPPQRWAKKRTFGLRFEKDELTDVVDNHYSSVTQFIHEKTNTPGIRKRYESVHRVYHD